MTRVGIILGVTLLAGGGLGGCSSALDQASTIGDREALRIGRTITPKPERNRIIRRLTRLEHTHRKKALREIANR